jgi:hypothetical protein
MIDGLRLTFTGDELRRQLEERAASHLARAEWWKRERARPVEEQTEEQPCLPEHICENEAEEHEWRAEMLTYIRDHVSAEEVYRLGLADLEFGDLLPPKPGWMEQDDYEERNRVGFSLERLVREVGSIGSAGYLMAERWKDGS